MAKTATPKKRQWQNLTDTRKLRHIENTLDKAIAAMQEEGGIESLEDFKNFVEEYSEQSGKAAIAVELCTEPGSDEIKGFRFYLTKDPNQRTSGKYLIKNLGDATTKDEDYFTPSNVMEMLGIEAEDSDELDLDEEDEDLDLDNDLDDLEEDLLDDEEEATPRRSTSKQSNKRSQQKPASKAAKRTAQPQVDEAEDDVDPEELLEDDEVRSTKPKNQNKTAARTVTKPQRRNRETEADSNDQKSSSASYLADNLGEEVSRLSANAATIGGELNGINEVGLAGQLTGLGIVLGTKGIAMLDDLIEQIKQQKEEKRLEDILKDLEEKDARIGKLFKRIAKVVESTPAEELPEELAPFADMLKPENRQSETIADNPIASAAAQVGEKIDKLGSQLDSEYKSQPLQLDKNAPISEQLDQIEKYLNKLSQRLDRLEAIVSDLEEKLVSTAQTQSRTTEDAVPVPKLEVERASSPPTKLKVSKQKPIVVNNSADVLEPDDEDFDEELSSTQDKFGSNGSREAEDPEDILEQIVVQRKVQQQRAACAESLVNFAAATAQVTQQSPQEGIPLTGGSTLFVDSQNDQLSFTLKSNNGQELFAGTKKDGQWVVNSDNLNPDEKNHILNLPQSSEDYAIKASAQALVEKFLETFPKRFSGEKEPTFTWKENKQPKYEFEILSLKGSKILQGFDPRKGDEQVFEAVLVDDQPPDIRKCRIPIKEMESLLGEPQAVKSQPSKNSKDVTKLERQEQQKKDELQA
ncbi:hypothetical protein [Iningainema tapete]|uniref:Uncharacterized protein n=1 Tax=Iningainema tapete BLCC-T55 TaxID=2748662 RepID=A0A8J6XJB5_9CYAN|nr:hypothetical protein [Iningainema tapete]MBD2772534.1 hypothetical protein [Iningainema tapete BLCC-T55]